MLTLIRLRQTNNICWLFTYVLNKQKESLKVFHRFNLLNKLNLSYRTFGTDFNEKLVSDDVKNYFTYLADAYTSNLLSKDENFGMLANSKLFVSLINRRLSTIENLSSIKNLETSDPELKTLKKDEILQYERELQNVDCGLLNVVVGSLCNETHERTIIEIMSGIGGIESKRFAYDMLTLYVKYLDYLEVPYEIIHCDQPSCNHLRSVSILLLDQRGYSKMKFEGGVHRVQRVPLTEKHGRMHTSTASVAILPESPDVDIQISEKDLKIETMRAGGPGGQHVNTTDSAVRITHLPTKIIVMCQSGKSQIKNKEYAMLKLKTLLCEMEMEKQLIQKMTLRKAQVGRRTRNEKIRTYNYQQDRVTDHRVSEWKIGSLKEFMENPKCLEELEALLQKRMQMETFEAIVKDHAVGNT